MARTLLLFCAAACMSLPFISGCSHPAESHAPSVTASGPPQTNTQAQLAQSQQAQGRAAEAAQNQAAMKAAGKK